MLIHALEKIKQDKGNRESHSKGRDDLLCRVAGDGLSKRVIFHQRYESNEEETYGNLRRENSRQV